MLKLLLSLFSHSLVLAVGIALGIYLLPILIAPEPPKLREMTEISGEFIYYGTFVRELEDSDLFHWGDGEVSISSSYVMFEGRLAPGPDYRLYFSPEYVETEADFLRLQPNMQQAGDVKTFDNFIVQIPDAIDIEQYNTVIVWCERFGQFISAAKYR